MENSLEKKIHNVCRKKEKTKRLRWRQKRIVRKYFFIHLNNSKLIFCYILLVNKSESWTEVFSLPFPLCQSLTSDPVWLATDWSILVMWPEYWPLIGQYWSRDLNTGLWLVNWLYLRLWLVNVCRWPGDPHQQWAGAGPLPHPGAPASSQVMQS